MAPYRLREERSGGERPDRDLARVGRHDLDGHVGVPVRSLGPRQHDGGVEAGPTATKTRTASGPLIACTPSSGSVSVGANEPNRNRSTSVVGLTANLHSSCWIDSRVWPAWCRT